MDPIKSLIEAIKTFFNESSFNEDEIFNRINHSFKIEIEKNGFSKKDISFLIELTIGNISLSTDILKDIFLNTRNTVEQKILMSAADSISSSSQHTNLDNRTLNIFSTFGSIYIHPNPIYLLWNNKNRNQHLSSNEDDSNPIKIKTINYSVFFEREDSIKDTSFLSDLTHNYLRNFGIKKENGFKTRYQLIIALDNDNTFTSLNEPYQGEVSVYLGEHKEKMNINSSEDVYRLIRKFKSELISYFKTREIKILNLSKLFLLNEHLSPFIEIIFNSLQKKKVVLSRAKIKTYQLVEVQKTNNLMNQLFLTEPCTHVEEYKKVYLSGDYFNQVNDFIQSYINYTDGRAVCVLCNETIKELNIQAAFFIDKDKFITTPDNILLYPPYNKFNNLKFFMDNLFYIFMFNTKMGIFNTTMVTRVLIDNLIFVSSKRIELEVDYKKDILDENIFFLRLTNNFFEAYDLEKERYKEKRMMYTNLPAYIIILVLASLSDYYDFFFLKKRMKLDKINKDWSLILFEDVMSAIIDSIFKQTIGKEYLLSPEKARLLKLKRSIQIYYEIFNDEFKLLYNEKKIVFEAYMKRLSVELTSYIITSISTFLDPSFPIREFNKEGQYLLTVKKIDMLRNEKERVYYEKRKIQFEDVNQNVNLESKPVHDFIINGTSFDKEARLLNLDLIEIDNQPATKSEINILDQVWLEFKNEEYYSYLGDKYTIWSLDNFYILDSPKQKIQFKDIDLLNIKSLNKYTHPNITEGDIFLYLIDLKAFHFEYLLRRFFLFLSKRYNLIINSNITQFMKTGNQNRRDLFLLKIKILNLITKLKI